MGCCWDALGREPVKEAPIVKGNLNRRMIRVPQIVPLGGKAAFAQGELALLCEAQTFCFGGKGGRAGQVASRAKVVVNTAFQSPAPDEIRQFDELRHRGPPALLALNHNGR